MNRKEMIEVLQGAFADEQVFTTAEAKALFSPEEQGKVFNLLRSLDADGTTINGRVLFEHGDYKRWEWDINE